MEQFEVRCENADGTDEEEVGTFALGDFGCDETVDALRALAVGQEIALGGGAQPIFRYKRIS